MADARDEKKDAADEAAALARDISDDTARWPSSATRPRTSSSDIQKKLKDLIPFSTGRRSDGSWAPQLPSGADNITARMRVIREQIKKNFTLPFAVGCFRSGGGGEHPLGRACDFMMSTGGSHAQRRQQRARRQHRRVGIENQDKLGVKYVIWKQRINHGLRLEPDVRPRQRHREPLRPRTHLDAVTRAPS